MTSSHTLTFNKLLRQLIPKTKLDRTRASVEEQLGQRIEAFYAPATNSYLAQLCDVYGSDKGTNCPETSKFQWEPHTYTDFYSLIFDHCRDKITNVLECGIGTNDTNCLSNMGKDGKPGASLRVWRDYFPNAEITGIDIDPNCLFSDIRIQTFQVDQTSTDSIVNFKAQVAPHPYDLIIDDGLRHYEAGICFFENISDLLTSNGVYIIEDVNRHDIHRYAEYFQQRESKYNCRCLLLYRQHVSLRDNMLVMVTKKQ
ncbi:methyltransferase domain-containing protein [Pseudovibrio sp. Tun.PSC04-5.I4]|uniref:methyltransferase domain-containing protein n=1 Tax=Pseudovibrio sp. Tun.PSC04-5.I4 TaxID=1798213 RepID=UPI00088C8D64|nr:methyltransferase domain-containing protein [Pseudovibrio sp. Tun.PSC04-5.I4]SDR29275.1 hypothetical protein SAMN04515695_4180 [Pseudovibrio sp. Tun.PSC04-5.I4]